jgi:phosphoglycerate kinase
MDSIRGFDQWGGTIPKKTIRDVDVRGKRVLVRVDYNVSLDKGAVRDDTRIRVTIPTVNYLLEHGAKVILISHLGRPKDREPELRMDLIAERLSHLIGKPVRKLDDCVGDYVRKATESMMDGDVILLENVRFHPEEEDNDAIFAQELAKNADLYVGDSFGTAHRAHSSTAAVTKFLPAVAGFLMEKEITYLSKLTVNPKHPFTVVLGGAKVSDKLGQIENFIGKASEVCVGGGMAFTFLRAIGYDVGKSLVEENMVDVARGILEKARKNGLDIELPVDVVAAERLEDTANHRVVPIDEFPKDWVGVDIGPATCKNFSRIIKNSATVFWNGPMGVYEIPSFSVGTRIVAEAVASCMGVTVIGGGDSVTAVENMGYAEKMDHVSTGGGASIAYLSGKTLPGIAALNDV